MVQHIPPPDITALLPPLLACLLTAFASPRPPPALLPLLSPILQQRVQLLPTTTTSSDDSWLHLLCWDVQQASKLPAVLESEAFEPHPVSGEIELGSVPRLNYRRLDAESLQARVEAEDLGLIIIYLWCEVDQQSQGRGWRVSEIFPAECAAEGSVRSWSTSVDEAEDRAKQALVEEILQQGPLKGHNLTNGSNNLQDQDNDDDDNDYWARYDGTPGMTPAPKKSPIPNAPACTSASSDAEYFAQYAQVQPAMDNDDPSSNPRDIGESTINGHVVTGTILAPKPEVAHAASQFDNNSRPSSSASSFEVTRLEQTAASQSFAELSIKQHISTSMKSLYRLARATGIETDEFERLVRTELETLNMMASDD